MLWMCRIRKVKHTPPQDDTVRCFFCRNLLGGLLYSAYMNGVIFILIGKFWHKATSPVMSYKSYGFESGILDHRPHLRSI